MKYLSKLKKKDLMGKTVLVRTGFDLLNEDFEVLENKIPLRIAAVIPTLQFLLAAGSKVVLLSHRGRPAPMTEKEKQKNLEEFSMRPVAGILDRLLKRKVRFIDFRMPLAEFFAHAHVAIEEAPPGSIFLLENLRFFKEETQSNRGFGKKLASLGNVYVNEAFSMDHRSSASVEDLPKFLPSYGGLSLESEIKNLSQARQSKARPLILIVGGAKISDKIGLMQKMLPQAQHVLVGGGVANTFNAAIGIPVGDSLYEKDMIPAAKLLLKSGKIILPIDFAREKTKILDIGPKTMEEYKSLIKKAKVVIWNGPLGLIGEPKFRRGSVEIAKAILQSQAFAVVGGGETVSVFQAVNDPAEDDSKKRRVFLSTGGGAMLAFLSGEKLPGLTALK